MMLDLIGILPMWPGRLAVTRKVVCLLYWQVLDKSMYTTSGRPTVKNLLGNFSIFRD